MGCLYSKMSRDSDDHYEKISNDEIDLATSADVEPGNDVVCGPGGKSDILDLTSSKDLEDGQNPSLDRERQYDAAQRMQVLKDITRAQLEELRRARDRLFKTFIYQEARQLARSFREAASAEEAQQPSLTDDATWLTPGGEGWEEEMTSFLATEEEEEVEAGKEEEKERNGKVGDGEGLPSSLCHEALLVADMFRQSPNIDMINPNEDEEEGEEEKVDEKETKEEIGDGEELHSSFLLEALCVADTIRQSPNINPYQDGENIDENVRSEHTTSSCLDEEDNANIFLDNVMEAVGFMTQESAFLHERAVLNKKIAYMQMLVLRRAQASFIQAHTPKEAPMETPPSHAEQTPHDESPYHTLAISTKRDKVSTSHHGDSFGDADEGVVASSTEDRDDVLVGREDEIEDAIDNDSHHGYSGSVRVFLDWLMGEVEARVDLDRRSLSLAGRVPSHSHGGIPAFPGTSGMTWDEALKHIYREDTRRGKEEEEKKDSEGEQGPGLRRTAARNSWLFKLILQLDAEDEERERVVRCQTMSVDMVNPNEDEEEHEEESEEESEEEGEEKKNGEKEKKEEIGDGEEIQTSFLCEALRVADAIRQSPNINPNQDGENIDENASSCGCYDDEIMDDEQTTSSCLDEEYGANIFLDNVMEAVGFMAQESALLNERAFLNKKIAYMQMLVLRRAQASFNQARTPKEAPMETPQSHAEQTPRDESPYQTLEMSTRRDKVSTSHHGDPFSDAEGVAASSTEDRDGVLVGRENEFEDAIDDDGHHGDSGSVRVFLDWLMGEVEMRVDLDHRLFSLAGRVPSQSHGGIPAFPGTSGMTWDEALKHIHREDTRRGKEEEEKKRDSEGEQGPGLRRTAARNSWLFKLILQLDAEDEEREQLAGRCQTMSVSRKD